jgi:hypothetical protein
MNTIIVDKFFDNFNNIKDSFKNIQLFNQEEFNKKFNDTGTWPGFRSEELYTGNPFLFNLIIKEIYSKFGQLSFNNRNINVKSHIHLRLAEDNKKDWIHKDPFFATLMVFLSETNLKSGTCLYDENKNVTDTINFVQNRALLFDSNKYHKSLNNYGDNLQNGRLTLNCFINLT